MTLAYSAYDSIGAAQGALYGMGMVVLAIFASAVYRLGRTALSRPALRVIAVVAGAVVALTNVGVASTLLIATALALCRWRVPPLPLILAAALLGIIVTSVR